MNERLSIGGGRCRISLFRLSVFGFAFIACSALADDLQSKTSWPMFRGDSRLTGVSPAELPEKLEVLWKFEATEPFESTAAISENRVFVGCDDNQFYCFDLSDGSLKWKYETKGPVHSSAAILHQRVFFGDSEGTFHALDAKSGATAWTFKTEGEIISSPNLHEGRIVFGSYDGNVYCLDAKGGKLVWKFTTEGRVHGTPSLIEFNPGGDGHRGDQGWFVLVAGCDEYVRVLKASDGTEVRRVSMGSVSGSGSAVRGSRAYIGTYGNQVRCIDWVKGETVWGFEDSERQFPFMASAAITEKSILLGGRDKRFRAFDPETGKIQWTFVAKGRIDSSAVVVGDRIFVGSNDGNLYALELATGKERWAFESGSPITASPAVADGRLVIGTQDGVLYCFGKGK